jgi:hypothetical protein
MYQKYKAAIEKVGNRCGYVSADETKQVQTLKDIAAELNKAGVCAAQSADSVSIKAPDNLYEEWHAVYYGNGCIIDGPNAYRGAWPYGGEVPPPPVSTTCPYAPCPEKTYEDGRPHWQFNAKQHTMGNADSTPVVVGQWEFCKSIGLGYIGEVPRASCPVRPDGHSEREAVENWLLDGGPVRDSKNGQDCTPNNTDNPYAFLSGTGNCRNCNTPKTVCTAWF